MKNMGNTKKLFEKPSKRVINEKVDKIKKDANDKIKELIPTKFRGAAIIIGLKNKLLKEQGFNNLEILPTRKNEFEGSKIILFKYNGIKYNVRYYFSNNEEMIFIHNENDINLTFNYFEIKELEDLKVIDLLLTKIKEIKIS